MPLSPEVLSRAGIRLSPDAFEALIESLVDDLARSRSVPLEDDRLPEPEAAALRRAGLGRNTLRPDEPDPIAGLAAAYAGLVASSLSVKEAARHLGVDPSRVRQRLTERTLLAYKQRGEWRLPRFQFEGAGTVPGLDLVAPRLDPDLHPVAVERWFTEPCSDLELDDRPVSPRDWLRAGGSPEIVAGIAAEII